MAITKDEAKHIAAMIAEDIEDGETTPRETFIRIIMRFPNGTEDDFATVMAAIREGWGSEQSLH
jgi:hypothetical protein